jgi:hypothetical protein
MLAAIQKTNIFGYLSAMRKFDIQETLNTRFRHALAFAITAVAVAALLRHVVHVYGGISPADIRVYALVSVPVMAILFAHFAGKEFD